MINNELHDEIRWQGKHLTIDTAYLGEEYNRPYETMALLPRGKEVETIRSVTLDEAKRAHRLMLERYKASAEELTGKYAKLRADLEAAIAETADLEQTEDGGTCNFDSPALFLPRWNGEKVKQAAKEAGCGAFKWSFCGSGRWVFSIPTSGQANRRSRRADAVCKALKEKGYNATMYLQMD